MGLGSNAKVSPVSYSSIIVPVVSSVIAGALVAIGVRTVETAWKNRPQPGISARRAKVLALVSEVVPSKYGDERFAKLAPGYDPSDDKLPPGFTTCGYLPLYIGHGLGAKNGITKGGLEEMRTVGKATGSWVVADGVKRPKPGDLYGLSKTPGGILTHVGVIIESAGDKWKTADAGQGAKGDPQEARYVDRSYNAKDITLGGPAGPRPFAGWLDIDAFPIENKAA